MAMEERQTKIREGAGLTEGRLNTEFIEMMKKWGPHLVTALAVLVLAYFGYHKWEEFTAKKNDSAFVELSAAATSASPTNLESVARDYSGTTVALEANLYAADLHMNAARTGVPIGAKFNAQAPLGQPQVDTNKLADEKPFLTADEQKKELAEAERLYQNVVTQSNQTEGQSLLAIGALSGLASISEDRAELDKAKSFYQQAIAKANAHKMEKLEAMIKKRMDSVDSLKDAPKLYAMADLPGAVAPVSAPMGGMTAKTADGQTITIGPGGQVFPGPAMPATPVGTTPITLPNGGSLNLTPVAPPANAPAVNPTPTPTPAPTPAPAPAPASDPKPATP